MTEEKEITTQEMYFLNTMVKVTRENPGTTNLVVTNRKSKLQLTVSDILKAMDVPHTYARDVIALDNGSRLFFKGPSYENLRGPAYSAVYIEERAKLPKDQEALIWSLAGRRIWGEQ